jgi:hypothetical protein
LQTRKVSQQIASARNLNPNITTSTQQNLSGHADSPSGSKDIFFCGTNGYSLVFAKIGHFTWTCVRWIQSTNPYSLSLSVNVNNFRLWYRGYYDELGGHVARISRTKCISKIFRIVVAWTPRWNENDRRQTSYSHVKHENTKHEQR